MSDSPLQDQRDDVAHAMASGRRERMWGMVIDADRCTGCQACAAACRAENNSPPGISYMVILEETRGEAPHTRRRSIPRPCMHCAKPSCVQVCPVSATFLQADGMVTMDYDKCIGCRYCMTNCPYGARSFDFGESYNNEGPGEAAWERRPSHEYDRAWTREDGDSPIGNVRKCHFCLHRVQRGALPRVRGGLSHTGHHLRRPRQPQRRRLGGARRAPHHPTPRRARQRAQGLLPRLSQS